MSSDKQLRPLSELSVWERNYNEGDIGAISTSIATFGYNRSIAVWRDGVVIAGNHTLLALQWLYKQQADVPQNVQVIDGEWWVQVSDVSHLSDEEATAYAIADNRTAALANPDMERLTSLLQEVANYDDTLFAATSYTDGDLDEMLRELNTPEIPDDAGAQIDKAAELQEKWQVNTGDLWVLGEHRLLCGDSTKAEDVERVMGGEKADAVVTDPPYNIIGTTSGADDGSGIHVIKPFFKSFIINARDILRLHGHMYACCDFRTYPMIYSVMSDANIHIKNCIVWDKGGGGLGSFYQNTYELIAFGSYHDRRQVSKSITGARLIHGVPNIWRGATITHQSNHMETIPHAAKKPLWLISKPVENSTDEGNIVYDPFGGSGTTMVVCEQLQRQCRMIEIEPKYCAVILERMSGMGLEPTLAQEYQVAGG